MLVLFSALLPPICTVREPGIQGAVSTGEQGWGVSTPPAAAVAADTAGLARLLHMPKGGSLLSITVAAGRPQANTLQAGATGRFAGAAPKEH